mmetsp:Transcript_37326/g.84570  ORF Transcript_37326/g.84570 Transcript_37326/m.84570 type:complete len:325 (-) Transcript_37326:203-1177(-)
MAAIGLDTPDPNLPPGGGVGGTSFRCPMVPAGGGGGTPLGKTTGWNFVSFVVGGVTLRVASGFITRAADATSFSFFDFFVRRSPAPRPTLYAITLLSLFWRPSGKEPSMRFLCFRLGPLRSSGWRIRLLGASPRVPLTSKISTRRPSAKALFGRLFVPNMERWTSRPNSVANASLVGLVGLIEVLALAALLPDDGALSFRALPFPEAISLTCVLMLSFLALPSISLVFVPLSSDRIFCNKAKSRPLTRCVCSMSPPRYLLCAMETRCCCCARSSRSPSCANVGAEETTASASSSSSISLKGSGCRPFSRDSLVSSFRRSAARSV